jgi:hypothetical protein
MSDETLRARVAELEQQVDQLRRSARRAWGREWRSQTELFGWPLVHVAYGRDENGKLRVAKGIIAIGQFAVGGFTIAQFGIGYVFGFGQFIVAPLAIAQFALSLVAVAQFAITALFGLGQFATGYVAIGQFAFGGWVRAVFGWGAHVWSVQRSDPEAVKYFRELAESLGL